MRPQYPGPDAPVRAPRGKPRTGPSPRPGDEPGVAGRRTVPYRWNGSEDRPESGRGDSAVAVGVSAAPPPRTSGTSSPGPARAPPEGGRADGDRADGYRGAELPPLPKSGRGRTDTAPAVAPRTLTLARDGVRRRALLALAVVPHRPFPDGPLSYGGVAVYVRCPNCGGPLQKFRRLTKDEEAAVRKIK